MRVRSVSERRAPIIDRAFPRRGCAGKVEHFIVTRAVIALLVLISAARAAEFPFTYERFPDGKFRFTLEQNSAVYFGFQFNTDLTDPFWATVDMALGSPGSVIVEHTPLPTQLRGFFRAEGIPLYAPRDSDFDGMDDIWELERPYLDPLNSADAFALTPNPNFPGLTNLDEYRIRFGLGTAKPQFYSREISAFNYGAARTEAESREVSLFNFGAQWSSVEALSREISLFNGEAPPVEGYPQLYSREVSLYNFGSPPYSIEALSREVSLFNGEQPPVEGYPEIYSREVSLFNEGAAYYSVEVISREVSVFNDIPQ